MSNNPFLEKENQPDDIKIEQALGEVFPFYKAMMAKTENYKLSWTHAKNYGWHLKVADKKKALYYLTPLENQINIGLTVRAKERETFLADTELSYLHDDLQNSKKYNEGYAMRFEIIDNNSFNACQLFIEKIMEQR